MTSPIMPTWLIYAVESVGLLLVLNGLDLAALFFCDIEPWSRKVFKKALARRTHSRRRKGVSK